MPERPKQPQSVTRQRLRILLPCVAVVVVVLLFSSLMRGCEEWRRMGCALNLKQVGIFCHMYAREHGGNFPTHWSDLRPKLPSSRALRVFFCPSTGHTEGQSEAMDLWSDYRLVPGLNTNAADETVLALEPLGNHGSEGANVLFVDGHVEWWDAVRLLGEEEENDMNHPNARR